MGIKLLDFDMFGTTIGFKHASNMKKKSYLGLCFSLLFSGLVLFFLLYFGDKYFSKDVIYQELLNYKYPISQVLHLNNTFTFALRHSIDELDQEDNEYFYVDARYYRFENKKLTQDIKLKYISCDSYDWNLTEDQIKGYTIFDNLCFNTSGLVLDGNSMSKNYSYIDIKYMLKLNDDTDHDKIILEYMRKSNPVATFHMTDTIYKYNRTFKGGEKNLVLNEIDLVPDSTATANLYMSVNEAKYYFDYMFQNIYDSSYDFSLMSYSFWFMPYNSKLRYVSAFRIFPSPSSFQYSFRQKALTEYVSELGGFLNVTLFVFMAVGNFFNFIDYNFILLRSQVDLVNENYDLTRKQVNYPKNNNNNLNIKNSKEIELNQLDNKHSNIPERNTNNNIINVDGCTSSPWQNANYVSAYIPKQQNNNVNVDINKMNLNNLNDSSLAQLDHSDISNSKFLVINKPIENNQSGVTYLNLNEVKDISYNKCDDNNIGVIKSNLNNLNNNNNNQDFVTAKNPVNNLLITAKISNKNVDCLNKKISKHINLGALNAYNDKNINNKADYQDNCNLENLANESFKQNVIKSIFNDKLLNYTKNHGIEKNNELNFQELSNTDKNYYNKLGKKTNINI